MAVNLLYNAYEKSLLDNEKNILFWENYLQQLNALDFNIYLDKLTVPVLVPIGSKIFFRGELKHTNDVTVAIGADYFTKCSVNQAEVLRQHRIKDAMSKLELLKKEKDFLQNQLIFSKQAVASESSRDIIEIVTEEEDNAWRRKHRKNMRKYKQKKDDASDLATSEISDKDLWDRLDKLELQEEIENEMAVDKSNEELNENMNDDEDIDNDYLNEMFRVKHYYNEMNDDEAQNEIYVANHHNRVKMFQQPSKLHLFELVVERHNALREMVAEMRAKQKNYKSEDEMLARLDETEKLEELEDEIAILEDMLASDDDDEIEEASEEEEETENQEKKSVGFAGVECETFELTFKHSRVPPNREPYDPKKGIKKPSDFSKAFSKYFVGNTPSILKKPKCDAANQVSETTPIKREIENKKQDDSNKNSNITNSIVVSDVVERVVGNDDDNDDNNDNERPMSLFKKRRQQRKE